MKAVKDMKTAEELKEYLLNVLSFTGGKKKEDAFLYHYAPIGKIVSIINSGYLWLGSPMEMNDLFERELFGLEESCNTRFYSCFSRSEENLAMYRMYANGEDGGVLFFSFDTAEEIVSNQKNERGTVNVNIVRNEVLTEETKEANLKWGSVVYKDLHKDYLRGDSVVNHNIRRPFSEKALLGLVKFNGWSYEREIRLIASLDENLKDNEKVAIKLPSDFGIKAKVILGPRFNKKVHRKEMTELVRAGIECKGSAYDGLVSFNKDSDSEKEIKVIQAVLESI